MFFQRIEFLERAAADAVNVDDSEAGLTTGENCHSINAPAPTLLQREFHADPLGHGALIDQRRHRHVVHRQAEVGSEGSFLGLFTAGFFPGHQLAQFRSNVGTVLKIAVRLI